MNKYQSYKSSGVEWIGEIPEQWDIKKVKELYLNRNERNIESDNTFLSITKDRGVIPYSEKGNVGNKTSDDIEKYKKVYIDDLVINPMNIIIGSVGLSKYNGVLSGVYMVLISYKNFNPKYGSYIFSINSFQKYLKKICYGLMELRESLNKIEFFVEKLPVPMLHEQQQIVQFLDEKTKLIDKLVSTKELKISLLKEQRTTLLNQVVTKGLNPNVKMKGSGVEWIEDIPENWLMGKIKFLSEIISKGTTPSTVGREVLEIGNIFYVKVENIKEGYVGVPPSYFIDEETDKILSRSSLKEDDILVVITGSTMGKVVILPKEFTPSNTNQGISFVRLKNKSNVRFVWYWLNSEIIQDRIKVVCTQSTQPNLSMEDLGNFSIPIPSELEQIKIVEHLDSKTKEIDDLIKLEQNKIDLLKEYRQSLISEVVTGKIKVTTD